ncbi:MAG TPA: hypothetical protein VK914_02010 [bacterium]|nr:hypothetical protein [bacterium]
MKVVYVVSLYNEVPMIDARRYIIVALAMFMGLSAGLIAGSSTRVMGISATSSKDPNLDLTGLLTGGGKAWQPGLKGYGAEEGVTVLFEDTVSVDQIQLQGEGDLEVAANGGALDKHGMVFSTPSGAFDLRSLFVHVSSRPHGPVKLSRILLFLKGDPVEIQTPTLLSATVEADGVLSPAIAYGPFHLFDSKPDFGLALDGKRIDPSKPVRLFDLTLARAIPLKGFFIWNGYQRSAAHYYANARPKKLRISSGDREVDFSLKDTLGPQWLALPGDWGPITHLTFVTTQITPGDSYQDLVVSEVKLVDGDNRIVQLQVPGPIVTNAGDLAPYIDRALVSRFDVHGSEFGVLKFRSDGTFSAFKEGLANGQGESQDVPVRKIWEGNWQPAGPGKIKIFGRAYDSFVDFNQGPYGSGSESEDMSIFRATLSIRALKDLDSAAKERLFAFAQVAYPRLTEDEGAFWKAAKSIPGACFVESSVFSDFVVPERGQE